MIGERDVKRISYLEILPLFCLRDESWRCHDSLNYQRRFKLWSTRTNNTKWEQAFINFLVYLLFPKIINNNNDLQSWLAHKQSNCGPTPFPFYHGKQYSIIATMVWKIQRQHTNPIIDRFSKPTHHKIARIGRDSPSELTPILVSSFCFVTNWFFLQIEFDDILQIQRRMGLMVGTAKLFFPGTFYIWVTCPCSLKCSHYFIRWNALFFGLLFWNFICMVELMPQYI